MAGWIDMKCSVMKNGMKELNMLNPIFEPGPVEPRYSRFLTFEGISVDESGKQLYLDAHVAFRMACLNVINYFKRFGYTNEQIYVILGTAPVEGRLSSIVDVPNACCTMAIPVDIFDFDVSARAPSTPNQKRGLLPKASSRVADPAKA